MGMFDNTPQPVREAIASALIIGATSACAATVLQQPVLLLVGLVLFAIVYFWRIVPQVKQAYVEQENYKEQRKLKNEIDMKERSTIARMVSFVPIGLTIGLYIMLPFMMLAADMMKTFSSLTTQ